jgi:DNA primase
MLWDLATSGRPIDTPERREGLRLRLREEVRRIADRAVASAYWQEIDTRLAAAFAPPAGRERPGSWTGRRRRFPGPPPAVGGAAARLGTRHLEGAAERIALAIAVNHPHLIAEHAEELAQAGLRDGNLDRLRRAIIDLAAGHSDLDAEGFRRHLTQMGFAEVLQGLFDRTRDIRVTQPTAPADRAAEELRHVLGLLREREAHKERELAERRLADDGTQENLARLDLARQATLDGESKRRDIDQIEVLPVKAR